MRTRLAVPAFLVSALAACSESTGPKLPTTNVTLHICPTAVVWAAYRNEGGNWTKVDMSADGTVAFDATSKVSFAWVQAVTGIGFTQVLNTTSAELLATNDLPCESAYGSASMTGSVTGLTGTQSARVTGAYAVASTNASTSAFTLSNLPGAGGIDVLAVRYPTSLSASPDKVIMRRGVVPTSFNFPLATIDFGGTEAVNAETQTVTFNNVGTDAVQMETAVWTSNNTLGRVELKTVAAAPYAFTYASVPAALRIGTDIHRMNTYAYNSTDTRVVLHYYATPAAKTFTFGPALSAATVTTLAQSPYPRSRATFASQSEYASGARVVFYQSSGGVAYRQMIVTTTAGYEGGVPATWTIETPDFSTAAYHSDYGLSTGQYYWQAQAYQGAIRFEGRPADGSILLSAYKFGSITP